MGKKTKASKRRAAQRRLKREQRAWDEKYEEDEYGEVVWLKHNDEASSFTGSGQTYWSEEWTNCSICNSHRYNMRTTSCWMCGAAFCLSRKNKTSCVPSNLLNWETNRFECPQCHHTPCYIAWERMTEQEHHDRFSSTEEVRAMREKQRARENFFKMQSEMREARARGDRFRFDPETKEGQFAIVAYQGHQGLHATLMQGVFYELEDVQKNKSSSKNTP